MTHHSLGSVVLSCRVRRYISSGSTAVAADPTDATRVSRPDDSSTGLAQDWRKTALHH